MAGNGSNDLGTVPAYSSIGLMRERRGVEKALSLCEDRCIRTHRWLAKESTMQCTTPVPPATTPRSVPLSVSPRSLPAPFAHVPDPRRHASITYALPALLTLAVAALLSNHLSLLAIAAWGARQTPALLRTLGFPSGRTPCQSTVQRLFSRLDGHALSAALGAHFAPVAVPFPVAAGGAGVAVVGKAQRGRLPFLDGGC